MRRICLILAFMLAGCATGVTSTTALSNLNRQFQGHNAREFFARYGAPASTAATAEGKTYRWVQLEPPAQPGVTQTYAAPDGKHYGIYIPPTEDQQYCIVSIRADAAGRIQRIAFIDDTPGKWSNSRCAEIFNP